MGPPNSASSPMERLENPGAGTLRNFFVRLVDVAVNSNNRLLGLFDFQQLEKIIDRCPFGDLDLDSLGVPITRHFLA